METGAIISIVLSGLVSVIMTLVGVIWNSTMKSLKSNIAELYDRVNKSIPDQYVSKELWSTERSNQKELICELKKDIDETKAEIKNVSSKITDLTTKIASFINGRRD
jgi:hypothetical protein